MPLRFPKRRLLLVSKPSFLQSDHINALFCSMQRHDSAADMLSIYLAQLVPFLPNKSLNLVILLSDYPPLATYGIQPNHFFHYMSIFTTKQPIFQHLRKPSHPSNHFDLLFLCKDLNSDFALCYIGNRYLLPEVHLKVFAKEFAVASLFAEQFEVQPLPAIFIATKMTESHYNLHKAFHAYHKKIDTHSNSYFSIGIDKKNRIVDFAKNTNYLITHWSDNRQIISRQNSFHTF